MLDLYHHGGTGNQFHRVFNSAASNPFELSNLATDVEYAGTVVNYTFDANGNMLIEGAGRSFEWDSADQLRGFAEGTTNAAYFYDSGGNRVKKVVRKSASLKEVTVYIDGGFEYLYTLDGTNTVDDEYNEIHVMDGRSRVARIKVEDGIADEVKYNLEDHLGNASFTLSEAGSLINREEYFPFGETSFGSYLIKRYRYNGKERDEESGLYYYGARYYAPWTCRFVSLDPLAGMMPDASPYCYAANNPVVLVDVDGLAPGGGKDGKSVDSSEINEPQSSNITALQSLGWYTTGVEPQVGDAYFSGVLNTEAVLGVALETIASSRGELIAVRPLASSSADHKNPYEDGSSDFLNGLKKTIIAAGPIGFLYLAISGLQTDIKEGNWAKTGELAMQGVGSSIPMGMYHGYQFVDTMANGSDYDRKRMLTTESINFLFNLALVGLGGTRGPKAEAKPVGDKMYEVPAGPQQKSGPIHHLFTNKFWKSFLRGGPWSPKFEKIFKRAGLGLDGEYNKVKVPGHKGPHPKAYHVYIYEKLLLAIEGLAPYTPEYRNAVLDVLAKLRLEAETPGTQMNKWLLKI